MSESTHSINLDVSRALDAQKKLAQGFDDVAKAGNRIVSGLEPAKQQFEKIGSSISNVGKALGTISSSTRLQQQVISLKAVYDQLEKLERLNKLTFNFSGLNELKQLRTDVISSIDQLRTMEKVVNTLSSQLKALPKFHFDYSSVEEYRSKLNNLGNELNALKMFKASINPLDYKHMEQGLMDAINKIKTEFQNLHPSSKFASEMVADFERVFFPGRLTDVIKKSLTGSEKEVRDALYAKQASYDGQFLKSPIAGNDISSGMFRQVEQIHEAMSKIPIIVQADGKVIIDSFDNFHRMMRNSLEKTSNLLKTPIAHGEIFKSLGGVDQNVEAAFSKIPVIVSTHLERAETSLKNFVASTKYQMMGFAGKQPFSEIGAALSNSVTGLTGSSPANVSSGIGNIGRTVDQTVNKLTGLGLVIKRVFEYGIVYRFQNALLGIGPALYEASKQMEGLHTSYKGIFGKDSESQFDYAYNAAQRFGKSIESVGESYKKFAVTSEYLGMSQKDTKDIFESINQAMVKVGGSSTDVQNAFRAVEQMLSKGTVSAEEFRRQFAQYIPGAMKMGADAVGKTTGEFMKMMSNGELVSTQFLPKFASQLKEFSKGWEEAANSIEANEDRIANALKKYVDNKGITGFFKAIVASAASAADSLNVTDEIEKRMAELKKLADNNIVSQDFYKTATAPVKDNMGDFDYSTQLANMTKALEEAAIAKDKFIKDSEAQFRAGAVALDEMGKTGAAGIGKATEALVALGNKLYELTGKTYTISVISQVDTTQLDAAMSKVGALIKNTTYAKEEALKAQKANLEVEGYNLNTEIKKTEEALAKVGESADKAELQPFNDKLEKARKNLLGVNEALQDVSNSLRDNERTRASKQFDATWDLPKEITTGSKNKELALAANYRDFMKESTAGSSGNLFELVQSENKEQASRAKKQLDALWQDYKATEESIHERGSKKGNGAARAAIAVDKYTESLQNLLAKEFALAEEDPLGAAFASIDEKANNLSHRMEELALRTKTSLKDIPDVINQYIAKAKENAAGKELENIFPWMKKDDKILSIWRLLTSEFSSTQAAAKKLGIPVEELTKLLLEASDAAQQMTKEMAAMAQVNAAKTFEDYIKAAEQLEEAQNAPKGSKETAAIKELGDLYLSTSSKMLESRMDMYKRVAEQAVTTGMDEAKAQAFVQSKSEEAELARLQAIEAYGTASEAFSARLAENLGLYKSAATKAREEAVEWADAVSGATDDFSSGVAGSIGDLIRNVGNGTASIEDLWKNMLNRMLDMFASFVEQLIKKQLSKLLSGMFDDSGNEASINKAFSSLSGSSASTEGGGGIGSIVSFGKSVGSSISDSLGSTTGSGSMFAKNIGKSVGEASSIGDIAGGLTQVASTTGTLAAAGTALSTIGTAIGGIGAIVGLGMAAFSLFGEKKEERKKTASGYNVGYNAGHATSYGVDFYNDGSVVATGASDPDVQKKIADAFRETAEALSDFAEELGFTVDVLEGFSFPNMNVTSDQLDGYIRNGENQMAFKGLMEAGMRGAFDYVARDGEVYVDEYERLSTSLSTVKGGLESYGYTLSETAMITQEQIEAIRAKNIEVAEGTAQAMRTMAESMGATADVIAQITDESTYASAALSVTDEQLSNVLEADYASDLLDAVGGEDAFSSMMGNITKNIFDSVEAYAENLDYYTERALTSISKLGDSTVTIDNFWEKFDAAIREGLTVDEFEAWGKASNWVNQINTVDDLVKEWDISMTKFAQSLDARMQAANGLDYQAELTQQLAAAEWELYEAREAGYDAALIARLQEVQAAELEATKRKHAEDYQSEVWDAQERLYSATGDKSGSVNLQLAKNKAELLEMSKTYNWSPGSSEEGLFIALEKAQAAELFNTIKENAETIAKAIESLNLDSREAAAAGNSNLAEALNMLSSFTSEYESALEAGVDQATLDRLLKVQQAELAQYWASIDDSLGTVVQTLDELKDILLDKFNEFISSQLEALQTAYDDASSKASSYQSAKEAISDTLTSWATDDDPTRNAQQTFLNAQSIFNTAYSKAMSGDVDAFGNISSYASTYKDAGQDYFGSVQDYAAFYRDLIAKMKELEKVAGTKYDEQDNLAKLYDVQINLYELLRDALAEDDPNTGLLQAIAESIGITNTAISEGNDYTSTLQNLTSNGTGGYQSIVDAITQKSSLPNTYLDTMISKQSALNSMMATFIGVQQKAQLQSQVDSAKTAYLQYYNAALGGFKSSQVGQYIQAVAGSGIGYGAAVGDLLNTGYSWSNGLPAYQAMIANGTSPSEYGQWFINNYGAGSGYVNWDAVMQQWLAGTGSVYGDTSGNYSAYQSTYQQYLTLLQQLQALGGYADGGISTGAQLAWVSEGSYATEAHVPLPDGRTIPVTVTSEGTSEAVAALAIEIANLRAEIKAANIQLINYAKTNADYVKKCDAIGTPAVREEA